MKKLVTIYFITFLITGLFVPQQIRAQSPPQKMSYQAVLRNSSNALIVSTQVGMQISILQASAMGGSAPVYVETQMPTTNINGLVSLEVGAGTVLSGIFSAINWANGPFYIKTETDPTGGTTYSITGTSQLLSVPYAFYAKTAGNGIASGTASGQILYWNGTTWVNVEPGSTGQILTVINGVPIWSYNASSIPQVTSPTGRIWMDRNLGSTQVATSSTDTASYGDLYQWGRGADGHQIRTSGTTTTLSSLDIPGHANFITNMTYPSDWRNPQNDNLWQGLSGTNNPCPAGYRIPTAAEFTAEIATWSSQNAAGAFASVLKLPVAGVRWNNGSLDESGAGYYWSSTVSSTNSGILSFYANAVVLTGARANGMSVRCIKD